MKKGNNKITPKKKKKTKKMFINKNPAGTTRFFLLGIYLFFMITLRTHMIGPRNSVRINQPGPRLFSRVRSKTIINFKIRK